MFINQELAFKTRGGSVVTYTLVFVMFGPRPSYVEVIHAPFTYRIKDSAVERISKISKNKIA